MFIINNDSVRRVNNLAGYKLPVSYLSIPLSIYIQVMITLGSMACSSDTSVVPVQVEHPNIVFIHFIYIFYVGGLFPI